LPHDGRGDAMTTALPRLHEMASRLGRTTWPLVCAAVTGLCLWNFVIGQWLRTQAADLRSQLSEVRTQARSFRSAVLTPQATTLGWVAQQIRWPATLDEISTPPANPVASLKQRFLLVNVRQD